MTDNMQNDANSQYIKEYGRGNVKGKPNTSLNLFNAKIIGWAKTKIQIGDTLNAGCCIILLVQS